MRGKMKNQLLIKTLLLTGLLFGFSPAISAIVHHSGELTTDEIWSASDVHVIDAPVTVPGGITLSIEPGAVLKFAPGAYLKVLVTDASFTVHGTETDPVIFTSLKDDTAGGDTNGDGNTTSPAAGDWVHRR